MASPIPFYTERRYFDAAFLSYPDTWASITLVVAGLVIDCTDHVRCTDGCLVSNGLRGIVVRVERAVFTSVHLSHRLFYILSTYDSIS